VRIRENIAKADGRYGLKYVEQVRVLTPGGYELWEDLDTTGWTLIESGQTSLSEVPLSVTYGGKMGTLHSKPPLLDIAHLNLTHYQRHADLIHALHIAAQPMLVLKGWDDLSDPAGLSVNNALVLPPEGDAFYVEPASSAFDAQRAELEALAEEISTLGIATLTKQKNTAESGLSKSLDRVDSNSMLALISKDLEQTLQQSLDWAAEFAGVQAPVVSLDRDFDVAAMEGQEISAINALFTSGLLDQRSALDLLKRGELLGDDFDVEEAMEAAEQEELASLEQEISKVEAQAQLTAAAAPIPPAGAASEPKPPKAK
jgi:BMFP domain-containing protein YqiC